MKEITTITKQQAKRFLLLKHGLLGEYKFFGRQGIIDCVRQSGCIQYDPIDTCGKNHEIVLFSKVKDFKKNEVYELLYKERELIDQFDKCMSICLISDWPYFEHERKRAKYITPSKEQVDGVAEEILELIRENGPVCSSDIVFDRKVDWYWNPTSLSRAALERLFYKGDLILHHKKNTRKYYDLPERHINEKLIGQANPNKNETEILTWSILRRIGSVGMLHDNASYAFMGIHNLKTNSRKEIYKDLAGKGILNEIKVEGIKDSFYFKSEDLSIMQEAVSDNQFNKRIEFIAPLDNIIWDRKIILEIFDFDYKWEIYTPQKERVYGYYVVPILYGEELIGRIELRRNKKEKKIIMQNIWADDIKPDVTEKINDKIEHFSSALY